QNGLPHHLDVPEEKGRLGDFFIWLRDQWRKLFPNRPPKDGADLWTGLVIDGPLGVFLATLHDKIDIYDNVHPRRREMHRSALGLLDPGLGQAPETIQEAAVTTWMHLSGVFNNATHSTKPEEFEAAVEAFEDFLIDRLAPRTF